MADQLWIEQTWPDELYGKLSLRREKFSIRLLRVLPGSYDQPLCCKLFRTTLVGSPSYQALSYTWGKTPERRSVSVNDTEVLITPNLHDALRTIRHDFETRTIWADALCINQHDVTERSAQVQEMGNIYGFADRVLIWLGPLPAHLNTPAMFHKGLPQWLIPATGAAELEQIRYESAMEDILSRPWWRRVWVVQEVCRARKDPVICLGNNEYIGLFEFAKPQVKIMAKHELGLPQIEIFLAIRERTRSPPRMRDWNANEDVVEAGRRRMQEDLAFLLDVTRFFDSTDPRDKIFALWTLVRGTDGHRLRPDYKMTMEQVYTAVSAELLTGSADLELLDRRWGAPRGLLPSWVPDYSVAEIGMPSFPVPFGPSEKVRSNEPPQVESEHQESVLVVHAVIIDTVHRVLSTDPFIMFDHEKNAYDRDTERLKQDIAEAISAANAANADVRQWHPELRILFNVLDTEERLDTLKAVALELKQIDQARSVVSPSLADLQFELKRLVTSKERLERYETEDLPRIQQLEQDERPFVDAICDFGRALGLQGDAEFSGEDLAVSSRGSVKFVWEKVRGKTVRIMEESENQKPAEWLQTRTTALKAMLTEFRALCQDSSRHTVCAHRDGNQRVTSTPSFTFLPDCSLQPLLDWIAGEIECFGDIMEEEFCFNFSGEWYFIDNPVDTQSGFRNRPPEAPSHVDRQCWENDRKALLATMAAELQSVKRQFFPPILMFEGSTGIQGFGSGDLQKDDKIAILKGYSSPCILREVVDETSQQKSYSFRGRAFLHIPEGPLQTSFKHKVEDTEPHSIRLV